MPSCFAGAARQGLDGTRARNEGIKIMSTRSNIAIEDMETGEVRAIYCHSDGYLEGVGQTLLTHWTDRAKLDELIALGDISTLGEEIGTKHNFDYYGHFYDIYKTKGGHEAMYADPEFQRLRRMVLAYHRDRGDQDTDASIYPSVEAYYESGAESWAEYLYLYRQGVWLYSEPGGNAGPFLVTAGDPNGEAEEIWRSVAGMLSLGEKPRSYAFGMKD